MSRELRHLHPLVQTICLRHQEKAANRGLNVVLISTYRDETEQKKLFMKGRDVNGKVVYPEEVVTNAPPGSSYHGVAYPSGTPASLAYHLALIRPGGLVGFGEEMGEAGVFLYSAIGVLGEGLGVTWGGRWRMRDYTHFEFRPGGAKLGKVAMAMLRFGDIHSLLETTNA
jgi:peptidoglycan L-alanyl-D-glutamate endopeptidase CwlK